MNTLGKILVFVNLLFSLVVSALIIMLFIARTNWKDGYERAERALTNERESHIAAIAAKNKLEAQKNQELAQVTNERDDAVKQAKLNLDQKTAAEDREKKKDLQLAASENTNRQLQATNENREAEVKNLDIRLTEIVKKNNELLDSTRKLSERAITAEIAYDSAKQRNNNLVEQVQELLKQVESARTGEAARTRSLVRNPPPEDIKGTIKAVADKDGLVTINLGSDSGLSRDHTLEVYRLKPNPQYVGMVRILDVRPNEAVGKLTLRRSTVQVGDEVASEIIGKR